MPQPDDISIVPVARDDAAALSALCRAIYPQFYTHLWDDEGAWYGEGGLRFIASPGRTIRPYLETTAGFARLNAGFDGGGRADAIVNTALRFFDRTEPILGAGGGVVVQCGPIFLDLGYRYQKILVGDSLQGFMTGGDIGVNQVRFGAGIRF